MDNFVKILKDNQVEVLRPDIVPGWAEPSKTPWWSTQKQYGSPCPRDLFIKFGDLLMETYRYKTICPEKITHAAAISLFNYMNLQWLEVPLF